MPSPIDRTTLLARIREKVGSDHEHYEPSGPVSFCVRCGAEGAVAHADEDRERYRCPACGHLDDRTFLFDGKIRFAFRESDGELVHHTVGALCTPGEEIDRHVLLFLRRKFPYEYTIPAGHLEVDEGPEQALIREVEEETGMDVVEKRLLFDDRWFDNPCSRGAGVHAWVVYHCRVRGRLRLSDEGRIIGWFNRDEVAALDAAGRLTFPTRLFLRETGFLEARP
jgi:8-oxo-dGTP pyrophosphatase MutT (NUDIX family)